MRNIKESFVKLKDFLYDVSNRLKLIINDLSVDNIKTTIQSEYKEIRGKLSDLKATNWDLAQYHFAAGNLNDAILRFRMLLKSQYKTTEVQYFLGRLYMEKSDYIRAKQHLNLYLAFNDLNYKEEAEYCMNVMSVNEVSGIPKTILKHKRNRLAINLETASIDSALLIRYHDLINVLKEFVNPSCKVLEIGCYIGMFGRILRETFFDNIQYLVGTEIGDKACEIAKMMHIGVTPVYDKVVCYDDLGEMSKNDNVYNLILIPDIVCYYGNLMNLFLNVFASLMEKSICVLIARTNNTIQEIAQKDFSFIGPIEEFRYSKEYVIATAKACGLNVKSDTEVDDDFTLFVFLKN